MADDDRLLEVLGRVLAPPQEEPPPERLAAFMALRDRGRPFAGVATPNTPTEVDGPAPARAEPPLTPLSELPELAHRQARRVGWVAAGASVAAAAVVVAFLAVPNLIGGRSTPEATVSTTLEAVQRLRTALASRDPVAVAEADANLLRVARRLPGEDQRKVRADAVSAHVDAIEFLRENPSHVSPSGRARGEVAAGGAPNGSRGAATATTVIPAAPPTKSSALTTVPAPLTTTVVPVARVVTIIAVVPQFDGSFSVEFGTAGFTPDASRRPGTHAVQFSFDDGRAPTIWAGPSPWQFSLEDALAYRQVCARVVDHTGVGDPASGNCRPIT